MSLLTILYFLLASFYYKPVKEDVRKVTYEQLDPYLHKVNDTVYIVNFWATWCGPCRKEMPAFTQISEKYRNHKLKVLLVSLDFPSQLNEAVIPYLRKNNIDSEVLLLDDPHQNVWIDKVDPAWSGGLPYTLIYGRSFRLGFDRPVTFNELDSISQLKLVHN